MLGQSWLYPSESVGCRYRCFLIEEKLFMMVADGQNPVVFSLVFWS